MKVSKLKSEAHYKNDITQLSRAYFSNSTQFFLEMKEASTRGPHKEASLLMNKRAKIKPPTNINNAFQSFKIVRNII